ncbi:hypothetical protein J2X63_001138 [Agromyces sp. 3263]|uniref:hypothetical protein n=1 Tax=Agromyces sp. 3263 TaxID=2817750 RepID=UPI002863A62A|nr:hypothetical protein [Agromyces sp. 3263]MDR6905452.1 hypothetical protein [Agromyces sp. 3263]
MNHLTHEVQVRLGIEIEDESVLLGNMPDPADAEDIERAIVWTLTTALDTRAVRDVLSSYGLAIRRGEVRAFAPSVATVMPGSGLDHTVAQAADPLLM